MEQRQRLGVRAVAVSAVLVSACSSGAASSGPPDAAVGSDATREPAGDDANDVDAMGDDGGDSGGADATCSALCAGACVSGRCLVSLAPSASPSGIGVDGMNVYVASCGAGDAGMVVSVPLAGGTPRPLASGDGCPVLAVGAAGLYVAGLHGGDVVNLPVDGGPPTTLASSSDRPLGIAVDA